MLDKGKDVDRGRVSPRLEPDRRRRGVTRCPLGLLDRPGGGASGALPPGMKPCSAVFLLLGACAVESADESSSSRMLAPAGAPGEVEVPEEAPPPPSATRVVNLLDEDVWILWGQETVLPGWDDGIACWSGEPVGPGATSPARPYDPARAYFVLSTASGATINGDGVSVSLVAEGAVTVLEIVVASASGETDSCVDPVDTPDPACAAADFAGDSPQGGGGGPTQLGPTYTGSANGNSTTKASWSQWWDLDGNDNANLRDTMKQQARDAAWSRHKDSQEYADRLAACRAAGGTNLYIATTDCSYWPGAGRTTYAKCTWTYRCLRLGR